jgi:hypothetical protein
MMLLPAAPVMTEASDDDVAIVGEEDGSEELAILRDLFARLSPLKSFRRLAFPDVGQISKYLECVTDDRSSSIYLYALAVSCDIDLGATRILKHMLTHHDTCHFTY